MSAGNSEAKALIAEGARIMTLCNACRYCEGYCAVFPAMERRTIFSADDLNYLANLCHNCGECYPACPYTPPHEYALNVPVTLAKIRAQSYREYSWPGAFFGLSRYGWIALGIALFAAGMWMSPRGVTFYEVIPHAVMAGVFSLLGVWILLALAIGVGRAWRGDWPRFADISSGLRDAFRQTNMHKSERRVAHHFTFYGFLLCFASTTVAAFYHFVLRWEAPYPYLSLPVVLGTVGGVGIVIGTARQIRFRQKQPAEMNDSAQRRDDLVFLGALQLSAVTGLALLVLRNGWLMPGLLALHLAVVFAFFVSMPYGKFVHGIYRLAALIRNSKERGHALD